MEKVQEESLEVHCAGFSILLLPWEVAQNAETLHHVWGGSSDTRCPRFSLGDVHVSTLCTWQTSRLPEERKQVFSTDHIVCTNSPGTVDRPYQLETGERMFLKLRFPDTSKWPNLQAGFSEDGSLRLFSHNLSLSFKSLILERLNLTHHDSGVFGVQELVGRQNGVM